MDPEALAAVGDYRDLTEKELAEIKRIYRLLDENGDNQISVQELYRGAQLIGINPSRDEAESLMKKMDDDGNGYIGYNEFVKVMKDQIMNLEEQKRNLEKAFKTFDKKNTGYLNKKQLSYAIRNFGEKLSPEEEEEFFQLADANGDGKITVDEFVTLFTS